MTNTKTAEKQDWFKYIKHVEFAMRSSPISGTHITPFEAARGRLPRLVIDNPLLDSELPESLPMEEHVAAVKKLMDTAYCAARAIEGEGEVQGEQHGA